MFSKAYYTITVCNLTLPLVSAWARKKERKSCRHQIHKFVSGMSLSVKVFVANVSEVSELFRNF
jgi:hypothetical protein